MGSPEGKNSLIHFGLFELDPDEQQLRKRGIPVKLQPQQFAALWMLTQRAGQIVSRDEIHQHIWGTDTFVDFERGINFAINRIRAALGDHAEQPRLIETIPRRGYRFIAVIENGEPGDSASATPIAQIENGEPAGAAASVTPISGGRKSTTSADQEQVSASSDVGAPRPARPLFATKILVASPASNSGCRISGLPCPERSSQAHGNNATQAGISKHAHYPTHQPSRYLLGSDFFSRWQTDRIFLERSKSGQRRPLRAVGWRSEGAKAYLHQHRLRVLCRLVAGRQQIAFGRCDDSGGGVFSVPALGGSERKLTDMACLNLGVGVSADVRWTADGKSLVLTDRCTPDAPRGIMVFSLQTGERRCLHSPPVGDSGDTDLALSPDEKTVAFLRWPTSALAEIYTVALSGGNLRQLTDEFFDQDIWILMWSVDGKYITFEPARDRMARVAASGGPVEFEAVYPKIGALSRDYRRLAYLEPELVWRWSPAVWRINLTHAGGRVASQARILLSATGGDDSAQLSADERQLVFASMRSGTHQIWRSDVDGSDPLQFTFFDHGYPGTPRWSPDGKWIVFDFHGKAHSQVYLVDSEGRNLHALTSGNSEDCVRSWSRDGRAVYFASDRTGNWQGWRREISSGNETQVTRHGGFAAFESYDAKTIYYSKFEGGGIWKIPVGGGQEDRVTDSLHLGYWGHFALTENGLYLVDSDAKGGPAIMYYNFQTGRLSLVLTFKQYPTPWFPNLAASRDGRMLFYAPVEFQSTMISMVENFQ